MPATLQAMFLEKEEEEEEAEEGEEEEEKRTKRGEIEYTMSCRASEQHKCDY